MECLPGGDGMLYTRQIGRMLVKRLQGAGLRQIIRYDLGKIAGALVWQVGNCLIHNKG